MAVFFRDCTRHLAGFAVNATYLAGYAGLQLCTSITHRVQPPKGVHPYVQEVYEGLTLLEDSFNSKGWVYVLRGLLYLSERSHMYRAVRRELMISLGLSAAMLAYMIWSAYIPQSQFLSRYFGPLGPLMAAPLTLAEHRILVIAIMHMSFIDVALDILFDATLVEQGQNSLVSRGRSLRRSKTHADLFELGRRTTPPRMLLAPSAVMGGVLLLPLNVLPFIGSLLYCLYNGWQAGPAFHSRYFELQRMVAHESDAFAQRHCATYTSFGAIDIAVGFIPILGPLSTFSSTVGAALWAADLERKQGPTVMDGATFVPPTATVVFGPDARQYETGM